MERGFAALAALFFLSVTAVGHPSILETYGDSLTAGFLSRTDVTHAPTLHEVGHILAQLAMYKLTNDPNYVTPLHAPDLAWPAMLVKTESAAGYPMTLVNQAFSGASAVDLLNEVTTAPTAVDSTLAFFFIGHNDLCGRTDTPEALGAHYFEEMNSALASWDARHTHSVAYLIPVGEISRVYHTLQGYVWHRSEQGQYSCENSWRPPMFAYCPFYADQLAANTLDTYMRPRLEAMDGDLDELVLEWDKKSGKNRYRYLAHVHDTAYDSSYFAVDCFHLSKLGQRKFAQRIAEAISPKDWP